MFQLIQSNSMQRLAEIFIDRAAEIERGPFEPQTVVVQSFGMGQWLKIRQAESLGIAGNLDCILPANLIWRLYQALLPESDLPASSPFSIERLTWHLMKRFPECEGEAFEAVRQFLDGPGDPQLRAWQLAEKIATLFDQYLIYRPDWINGWDAGHDEPASWQRTLWRMLGEETALAGRSHRARLHRALVDRLTDPAPLPNDVPRHISVIGLSTLPPIHLEALQALSRHIHVDLYFLNPCQHYWGDIISEKDQARRSIRRLTGKTELADEDYLEVGNPLLSSWGKQGREFLELLLDTEDIVDAEFFQPASGPSLLASIQRDIFELSFGGEFGTGVIPEKQPVEVGDLSVQIHVCHSKMREVEVLYDQLLRLFEETPDLVPADVIVMTPDVADYAPFVEAVFPRSQLPYTIADRALGEESPVLLALSTLLSLPDLRLTSSEVMDLLEVPTIARRFELDDSDLQLITRWIQTSGIRWELDGEARAQRWQVPATRENTWRFGLDRLLLGFAMREEDGTFSGILPCDVDSAEAGVLGTFCDIVERIAGYRDELAKPHTTSEWRALVLQLIDDFFDAQGDEELELASVRDLLIQLEEETTATGFVEPLTPRLFRHWLDQQLSINQQSRGFISGGVTFATLVPMRSIPFRVVCLLGMNDGNYPREDRPPTFDLMAREGYRRGDRSKRNDDRYLFLEALISAEDTFYVSYEGRGIRDNKEKPPSVLVGELLDYLDRAFDHDVVTHHPLQPFSPEYYQREHPGFITYRRQWFDALVSPSPEVPFIGEPLAPDPELALTSIDQLKQFFRHPARTFLRARLGIYIGDDEEELGDAEPFELDGLERFGLAEETLGAMMAGRDPAQIHADAVASGHIMPGDMGTRQFDRILERATMIQDAFRQITSEDPTPLKGECVLGNDVRLTGTLANVYGSTIVNFRPATLHKRQVLSAWIDHLFVNAIAGASVTKLLSIGQSSDLDVPRIDTLTALEQDEAIERLTDLARLYEQGMTQPLPLLPETSHAYLESLNKHGSWSKAAERALSHWERDSPAAEGMDPNYTRLFSFPRDFDETFVQLARRVFDPVLQHWGTHK